jgi:predicted nuclease of predicted toxin-antitoxin system
MPLKDFAYWIDANLPPKMAGWLNYHFGVEAQHVYEMIGLLASDESFYRAAKRIGNIIIITKDIDFIKLQQTFGPPPKIIRIAAGNLSNDELHLLLKEAFEAVALKLTDSSSILTELNRT